MEQTHSESTIPADRVIPGGTGKGVVLALKFLINLSGALAVLVAVGLAGLVFRRLGLQLSGLALGPARGFAEGSAGAMGSSDITSLPLMLEAYFTAVPVVLWLIGLLFVVASLFVMRCMLSLIEDAAGEKR